MTLRLSESELQDILNKRKSVKKKASASKYRNEKVGKYDSKKEAKRAQYLQYEQHAGLISNLEEQPEYELIPKQQGERAVKYIADFRYVRDGETVVEDVKSVATRKKESYILKRKLMLRVHGIRVLET